MKKIVFCIGICFWILTGCSDSWLEPKPLSFFAPELVLSDAAGMETLMSACNRSVRKEFYHYAPMCTEGLFSDISVDGTTDKSGPTQNMNTQVTPSANLDDYINTCRAHWYWTEGYKTIKNANTIITYIDNPKYTSPEERDQTLANAYFYRSYFYYRLVNQYGDVPFIGRLYSEPKLDFYSTKRSVILQKLQKDMEFAVEHAKDGTPRGEVTKGACQHLLAKIYLASGEFDKAIEVATDLITGGKYELMTQPFGTFVNPYPQYHNITRNVIWDLHRHENKAMSGNKEVLFMVLDREDLTTSSRIDLHIQYNCLPFWAATSNKQIYCPDGSSGGMNDNRVKAGENFIPIVEIYGRGVGKMRSTSYQHTKIWDDPKDLRHSRISGNWMEPEDLVFNNKAMSNPAYYGTHLQKYKLDGELATIDTIRNWFGWPHYKTYCETPRATKPTGGAIDWYIFRLAETYLLRAEAYWWKGEKGLAMADINKVRQRAGCDAYTDESRIDILTILAERARELFFEEPRKTELTRVAYLFAQTGKTSPYGGKTYTLDGFSTGNFWYDHIMATTDFYNTGAKTVFGESFTMSPFHVLWPVPQGEINGNALGVINQNKGYFGVEANVPPLDYIPAEEDL